MSVQELPVHGRQILPEGHLDAQPFEEAEALRASLSSRIAGEVRFDDASRAIYATVGPLESETDPRTLDFHHASARLLVAEGKGSKEVATLLEITTKTAETHRANLMRKLEIHNVTDPVRYAVRSAMIEP